MSDVHTDPSRWLDDHGDVLFGYALQRVRRRDVAEDLVQETLLAAIKQRASYDARSELRTWLVGILRHKIIDQYRRSAVRKAESIEQEPAEPSFTADGRWKAMPADWANDPTRPLDQAELRKAIDDCRDKLPPLLAGAYVLREIEEISVEEACNRLDVSANHLAVRLYRARLLMRDCVGKYLAA